MRTTLKVIYCLIMYQPYNIMLQCELPLNTIVTYIAAKGINRNEYFNEASQNFTLDYFIRFIYNLFLIISLINLGHSCYSLTLYNT